MEYVKDIQDEISQSYQDYMGDKHAVDKHLDNRDKWLIALVLAVLFAVVASPYLFKLVNQVTQYAGVTILDRGMVNMKGLLTHALVFGLIVRILLW